jgi:hypothetical protein
VGEANGDAAGDQPGAVEVAARVSGDMVAFVGLAAAT